MFMFIAFMEFIEFMLLYEQLMFMFIDDASVELIGPMPFPIAIVPIGFTLPFMFIGKSMFDCMFRGA
jgi:hypothetical protein